MKKPEQTSQRKVVVDISIDQLLQKALSAISMALDGTIKEIAAHGGVSTPSRECVANLKDCLSMLSDLKKKEQDLIDSYSVEELEKISKG